MSLPTPVPGPREVRQPEGKWPSEYRPPVETVCPDCRAKHTYFSCPYCRHEERQEDFV